MGRVFEEYVDSARIFRCAKCNAHLARNEDIISKKEAHNASEKYKEGKFILELAKTDQLP
ncbi:hypothetical protein KXD40_002718 [Peronospora effusa]|uniref:Yippee domain-containing protein n=1 Tax=Peronospora effusa TaxID=542832 RepID=A0A3M6VTA4_9STRA|nr:hypothetical protein DD238_001578 [Peronospora effusa]RQM12461.1 hypothetical protein DD237_004758 [Peronospora effusa]UIZ29853.1 hypothetical protein KXD40_002718 [Peronospora effusa]